MKLNELPRIKLGTPEWEEIKLRKKELEILYIKTIMTMRFRVIMWIAKKLNICICLRDNYPTRNYKGNLFDIIDGKYVEKSLLRK